MSDADSVILARDIGSMSLNLRTSDSMSDANSVILARDIGSMSLNPRISDSIPTMPTLWGIVGHQACDPHTPAH